MIKLIKTGRPKKKKCKYCKSKMEYEISDIVHDARAEWLFGHTLYYIVCPNCGEEIYVKKC